jgi:hypothetical protein
VLYDLIFKFSFSDVPDSTWNAGTILIWNWNTCTPEGLEFTHSFWDLGLLPIGIWAGPPTSNSFIKFTQQHIIFITTFLIALIGFLPLLLVFRFHLHIAFTFLAFLFMLW